MKKSKGYPHSAARKAASLLIPVTEEEYLILSLLRSPQKRLFRPEEINRINRLVPRMKKPPEQFPKKPRQRKERGTPSAERIGTFFGLTRAESAVCEHLVRGLTPKRIAAARNVSFYTVREQLRTVYRKTGFRTQRDLVAAILRLVR